MRALLIVDMQHDFMPGGALGVMGADRLVPLIAELMPHFSHVIAILDWHPPGHISFASAHGKKVGTRIQIDGIEQVLWPNHCVQNTHGAELVKGIPASKIERTFHKGVNPKVDSYSVFFDVNRHQATGLATYLHQQGIDELFFAGVALDYCVLYSALDALEMGFKVFVLRDACKAISDEKKALRQMEGAGAKIIYSSEVLGTIR